MKDTEILAQFDKSALIGIQIMIAVFVAVSVILSILFSVAITAFIIVWLIVRKVLLFVFTRHEAEAVFALAGGRI